MSSLRLNDIWRSVNEEIGFFTTETFKNISPSPGVYAWFYPLRIVTKNLDEFINQVDVVLNYDCETKGIPKKNNFINFSWDSLHQQIEIKTKIIDLTAFKKVWDDIIKKENEFDELRKVIMRSSIFLPPLYVGKTNNLYKRCQEHINGNLKDNNFHNRFEKYATDNNFAAKKVSDLLFVTIKTSKNNQQKINTESLVEAILKYLSKPKYSKI